MLADLSRNLNPIESRKANVQQDQVGLQLYGFLNRLSPVGRLADDRKF